MTKSLIIDWGREFLNKVDLTPYKTILDVGCRQGHIIADISEKYKSNKIIAIDNLDGEIQHAKSFYQLPNLTFECQDALTFKSTEQFDAIVSLSCLHWIKDKATVVNNLYSALKPGGKLFLQFFVTHGRPQNDRFFFRTAEQIRWKNYFKDFVPEYCAEITAGEFCLLLQHAGFIIHQLEFNKCAKDFEHPDALHQWFSTWASHKHCLPVRKQDTFLDESVKSYLTEHEYSFSDPFTYYEYVLEVICEKPLLMISQKSPYRFDEVIFSRAEAAVLKHFLLGKSAKEIALVKSISPKTVEFHWAKIKEKLNCRLRSEIFQSAYSKGFYRLIYDLSL